MVLCSNPGVFTQSRPVLGYGHGILLGQGFPKPHFRDTVEVITQLHIHAVERWIGTTGGKAFLILLNALYGWRALSAPWQCLDCDRPDGQPSSAHRVH
jgi:hypothetical protein